MGVAMAGVSPGAVAQPCCPYEDMAVDVLWAQPLTTVRGIACITLLRQSHSPEAGQQQVLKHCAGVMQWDSDKPPRYLASTDLPSRVKGLNPRWNEEATPDKYDAQFAKAMALTGRLVLMHSMSITKHLLQPRQYARY